MRRLVFLGSESLARPRERPPMVQRRVQRAVTASCHFWVAPQAPGQKTALRDPGERFRTGKSYFPCPAPPSPTVCCNHRAQPRYSFSCAMQCGAASWNISSATTTTGAATTTGADTTGAATTGADTTGAATPEPLPPEPLPPEQPHRSRYHRGRYPPEQLPGPF